MITLPKELRKSIQLAHSGL